MALLDGLLHCYTPSLGPTGYRLIDRGPRRVHGVAASGIASSVWQAQKNGWCLRGSNAGNQEFTSAGTFPTGDRTVAVWWRAQVALAQFVEQRTAWLQGANAIGQSFMVIIFNGVTGTGASVSQYGDSINTTFGNDNVWHLITATNTGSSWAIYGDGRLLGSKTMTTNQTTTAPVVMGGNGLGNWSGDIGETTSWNRVLSTSEVMELYRRGDGGLGRMLTGQSYREARLSQAIAATTNRRRRLICGSQC